ncbi:MurR/RpiR family transcriptional regulator [Williamsoniiplasma lucivorax]|uniref:HTH rpiR-type domain-containing protein n=1 Tax=Williamsoniiplasma lucivorax TaxID=209274 RepID=A0A2S5RFJ8_9MOLU|nr:MurR/RpiR family transcriptional regulator [Williamsoniiplasma lucivorax]PPE06083.1 hypothetical protein ELUCI_v1c03740 [Williamsoniiplasma lucivorax]
MKSILGRLIEISDSYEQTSTTIIASVILENYLKGEFFDQKELAEKAHVSVPLITLFCQKLGFSGYKEFKTILQLEHQHYFNERKSTTKIKEPSLSSGINLVRDIYKNFFLDIVENECFLTSFIEELKNNKGLTIFTAYSTTNAASFAVNLFNGKGYSCRYLNEAENHMEARKHFCENKDVFLVILFGQDTKRLFGILKTLDKNKVFIITSTGKRDYVKDYKNVFVIKSHLKFNGYFYRTILLESLFMIILESIENDGL